MLPHSDNNFRWQWPVSVCLSIWHRQYYDYTIDIDCTYSWDYQTDHILRISDCPWPMELHLYPLLFYHIEHWTPAAWCRFLQHWSTFNNTSVTLILSQKGSHYITSTNTSSTNSQFNNLIWIQPIQNNVALQRYDKYKFCPLVSILQLQLRIISS